MRVWLVVGQPVPGELLVRGRYVALLEPELLEDDVARLRDRRRLVERDVAVEALPPEAAIGREHELVRRNVFERAADPVGDHFREVALERTVADDADRH